MRQHGRVYDKKYLVLRFDVYASGTKSKNEDKLNKLRWQYAGEHSEFKKDLIDKFCSVDFTTLAVSYFDSKNRYKKPWIFGPFDIGLDMLEEEVGLVMEFHWMYVYYKIPRENVELIKFFEDRKFSFKIKTVQTI